MTPNEPKTMTTASRIDRVRELNKAATKGPWKRVGPYQHGAYINSGSIIAAVAAHVADHTVGDDGSEPLHGPMSGFSIEDGDFIAEARTLMPALAEDLAKAIEILRAVFDNPEHSYLGTWQRALAVELRERNRPDLAAFVEGLG